MAYRKKTLRQMPQVQRELAKLINELDSIKRRAKHLLVYVGNIERDSKALKNHSCEQSFKLQKPKTFHFTKQDDISPDNTFDIFSENVNPNS